MQSPRSRSGVKAEVNGIEPLRKIRVPNGAPDPLQRPVARSAHGRPSSGQTNDLEPITADVFTDRPVTHGTVSPSKKATEVKLIHADPSLSRATPPPAPPVNIMTFMSSVSNELKDEERLVHETRAQYENVMNEQRRRSSMGQVKPSPRSTFGFASGGSAIPKQSPSPDTECLAALNRRRLHRRTPSAGSDGNAMTVPQATPQRPPPTLEEDLSIVTSSAESLPAEGEPRPIVSRRVPPTHRRRASVESDRSGVGGSNLRIPLASPVTHQATPPTFSQPSFPRPIISSRDSSSDKGSDLGDLNQIEGEVEERGVVKKKRERRRNHLKGTGRIKVCVRKRPLNAAGNEGGVDIVETQNATVTITEPKERIDLSKYDEKHVYQFDEVFTADDGNREVFERAARPLLDTFFEGGNASIFAYGQTGSGKTHTMLGHRGETGLYLLAAQEFINRLSPTQRLKASFYEIYCNTLYDLLNERKILFAREDGNKRVNICGLSEHPVDSVDALMALMKVAENNRSSGSTAANELSSRSHAILCIGLSDSEDTSVDATFRFIDLAGSERGADTADRDKKTQMEGAEINKSLLALKECIRGLDLGHQHIKFRGSKLTEVLRSAFTGNCRTVMIATLSPSSTNVEHTLNTLRYAHRVKGLPIKSLDPSKDRNQPRRRSTSAGAGDGERKRVQRPGMQQKGHKRRSKSMPLKQPGPDGPDSEGSVPPPNRLPPSVLNGNPSNAPSEVGTPTTIDMASFEDELEGLDISPAALAAVRRMLQKQQTIHRQLEQRITALYKEKEEREAQHRHEMKMCKMVKTMDEQRISLLEGHNASLQRKIQQLTK